MLGGESGVLNLSIATPEHAENCPKLLTEFGSNAGKHNVPITDMLNPVTMSANNTITSLRYTRDRPSKR